MVEPIVRAQRNLPSVLTLSFASTKELANSPAQNAASEPEHDAGRLSEDDVVGLLVRQSGAGAGRAPPSS